MAQSVGTIQRRLESVLDDFKQARTYWHDINREGFSRANTLVNAVIQSRYVDNNAYWHPMLVMEFPDLKRAYDGKMKIIIRRHEEQLSDSLRKLARQHDKMQGYLVELQAIYKRAQQLFDAPEVMPLYRTCSLSVFVQRSNDIVAMYSKELSTKQMMLGLNGLQHVKTREEGLTLLSIWLNEPRILESVIQEFEEICSFEMDTVSA
ncbi:uncharacterized protein BYT42DRAFT_569914 [Radiomyces spectabilis]|uniref:uncharacterized protein n=1 Tax=Radiomyces spectabilis TaxID=64574 RepID=UPI0022203B08|nr:uncharacterized protein BYT42DRAFT_569914 [Radiomyces spectabilis]KAI8379755.1 hypothetical protein BYT42DRAFT_569914 [Radiomyces spectabilis]